MSSAANRIRRPCRGLLSVALSGALIAPLIAQAALAQATPDDAAQTLDRIHVLGQPQPLTGFPGAATALDINALRDGQRQASLAELLQRGLGLVSNGIPASAADGQGQAATFALAALDRLQVLRGPLALVHGNGAGGVIVGDSLLDGSRTQRADVWADSQGSQRIAVRADGRSDDERWRWRAHGSHLHADGHRPHSGVRLSHAGGVLQRRDDDGSLQLTFDALHQPWTDDPLGLTREHWQRDPHGTDPAALLHDSRKRVDNLQAGLRWSRQLADGGERWLAAHAIDRRMQQFLAIPPGAQIPPTSAGGMIALQRQSSGVELGQRWQLGTAALAIGAELGRLHEDRQGHENFSGDTLGVRGRLRRDERNRIDRHEAWLAWEQRFDTWTLLAAARHSRLRFASQDRYIAPGNPDDSGRLHFTGTAAALGLARRWASTEVFASIGRGFETPTVTELAYRPDGEAGFNRDLRAARFRSAEAGLRWRGDALSGSAAWFVIDGRGEIVPALSSGGRASFANAGRTRRHGIELAADGRLGGHWRWRLVGNALQARFVDGFSHVIRRGEVVQPRHVAAGNRVPGIPRVHGFAELAWQHPQRNWSAALEAAGNSAITVDDANSDAAPGHVRLNLVARWRSATATGWHGFLRIDNLADRNVVGSVIVNEANGRHFEPAPGRGVTLGIGWNAASR